MQYKIKYIDKFSIKGNNANWIRDKRIYKGQEAHQRTDELLALGYLVEMTKI